MLTSTHVQNSRTNNLIVARDQSSRESKMKILFRLSLEPHILSISLSLCCFSLEKRDPLVFHYAQLSIHFNAKPQPLCCATRATTQYCEFGVLCFVILCALCTPHIGYTLYMFDVCLEQSLVDIFMLMGDLRGFIIVYLWEWIGCCSCSRFTQKMESGELLFYRTIISDCMRKHYIWLLCRSVSDVPVV